MPVHAVSLAAMVCGLLDNCDLEVGATRLPSSASGLPPRSRAVRLRRYVGSPVNPIAYILTARRGIYSDVSFPYQLTGSSLQSVYSMSC